MEKRKRSYWKWLFVFVAAIVITTPIALIKYDTGVSFYVTSLKYEYLLDKDRTIIPSLPSRADIDQAKASGDKNKLAGVYSMIAAKYGVFEIERQLKVFVGNPEGENVVSDINEKAAHFTYLTGKVYQDSSDTRSACVLYRAAHGLDDTNLMYLNTIESVCSK